MRSYDVAIAALAAQAPRKWVENLLSANRIPELQAGTRGVARRVPHDGVVRIACIRELHSELGVSVRRAVEIAEAVILSEGTAVIAGGRMEVRVDLAALRSVVNERLRDALESAPRPRRGRPPKNRRI